MTTSFLRRVSIAAILLIATTATGWSQASTARIRGTVTDPSGGVLPNVTVTATNTATNVAFTATTQGNGTYEFLQLPLGTYTVSVEAPGFQRFQASGIVLNIDQEYVEPVKLSIGSASETVTVQASEVQVDTTNMQLNNEVTSTQITELPLIGRNFTQLEQILPGVQSSSDRFGTYSANGSQSQQSSFLINGTDTNDLPLNTLVFAPSVDALAEFNVITSSLNPEYSRNSGAIVSTEIKHGSNSFHGDVFEFYRDTFLNTHNFFQHTAPKYHQNIFGGTLGGPIFRDKLFFFGSYQGTRAISPQTVAQNTVYSATQLTGNFSNDLAAGSSITFNGTATIPATVHIPGCTTGDTYAKCFGVTLDANGNPLPGQSLIIPGGTAAFNPVAYALVQKYVPLPNTGTYGYQFNPTTTSVQDQGIGRIDWNPTSKDQIWGVAIFQHAPSSDVLPFTGSTLPGFGDVNTSETHQFTVHYARTIGASSLNEIQAGYTRFNFGAVSPAQVQLPSSVGFAITPQNPAVAGLPNIAVGSNFTLGFSNNGPQPRVDQTYQLFDNYSKVVGRHSLKFGYNGRRFNVNNPFYGNNNGTYGFSNANPLGTGDASLDFLLGIPNTYTQGSGGRIDAYAYEHYFYGQDQWKVTDNFTITYGLGYQIDTALHNRQYKGEGVTCFVPGQQSRIFPTAPPGLNFPGDPGCNDATGATDQYKDFGPRFGFAWSPDMGRFTGGPGRTSIRGGFGLYYNRSEEETSLNNLGEPPYGLTSTGATDYAGASAPAFINPFQDLVTGTVYPNKFPVATPQPGQPIDFSRFEPFDFSQYSPSFKVPYAENFQLSIERQLPSAVVARVSYVGSLGRREQVVIEGNPITPAGHAACLADPLCSRTSNRNIQPLVYPSHTLYGNGDIFPSVGLVSSLGTANYHALQLSMQKGYTHGLVIQASYTFAHSMDTASSYENSGYGGSNGRGFNQYDTALNYGNSAFDARHRFVFAPVYRVPTYKGFGNHEATNLLLSGWEISGILTLATGFPFDISYGGGTSRSLWCSDVFSFYACPDVPEQVAPLQRTNPRAVDPTTGAHQWFTPSGSFAPEPIGSFGNISRNRYHGPGINNTDVQLAKNIFFWGSNEDKFIQLRLESYNAFNHTQFVLPGTQQPNGNFTSSGFGQVTGARAGRQSQLVVKIYF